MYPFDISEVVVIELIANALDAKANRIKIDYDPKKNILVVEDNGQGMSKSQFDEYHDFAAGLKVKGTGIGFAGLGAKVSFDIATKVLTETKSESLSRGSNWYLHSKKKLLWEDVNPIHLKDNGTRVEVHFRLDTTPSYESTEDLVKLLYRHYLPLLDLKFLDLYGRMKLYHENLRFIVNGQILEPVHINKKLSLDKFKKIHLMRREKQFGYGIFGVSPSEYPIAPEVCGVLLCTYGKVIKVESFNQFPGSLGPQLFGLVEVPELVKFLTTSKTEFMRKGKHREFEKLYDPIRQEFKAWLSSLGIEPSEIEGTNEAAELERELRKISEDIPELNEFFGFWSRKNVLKKDDSEGISAITQEGIGITFPHGQGVNGEELGPVDVGTEQGEATIKDDVGTERAKPISRKARRGPKVAFDDRPDRLELAWVEGNNVVINSGHPSYVKSHANIKAKKIHNLFAVANAVLRFIGSGSEKPDLMFIDRVMSSWGQK